MTRRKWTTEAQEDWLKARIGQFSDVEKTKECRTWFQEILASWLETWPNPSPMGSEITEAGSEEKAIKIKVDLQDKVKTSCQHKRHS